MLASQVEDDAVVSCGGGAGIARGKLSEAATSADGHTLLRHLPAPLPPREVHETFL